MDLFGSAINGIDPQNGSYLSKERRIAMFQASRGYSGGNDGTNSEKKRVKVSPQNSIVVVNKFAEITQTLSNNYEKVNYEVSQQVEKNRSNIENLYSIIQTQRKNTLSTEKLETRNALIKEEKNRRKSKENLIEGISSSAAAAVAPLQKAASAAVKPLKSFWEKIRNFLLLIGSAWVIDNLSSIQKKIKDYFSDIENLKLTSFNALTNLRGVFSIFDGIIKSITRLIGGVIKTAFRVGQFIATSAIRISRSVFGAIKKVVTTVLKTIFKGITGLIEGAVGLYNKLKGIIPNNKIIPNGKTIPPNNFQKFMGKITDTFKGVSNWTQKQFVKARTGATNFMSGFKDLKTKALDSINPLKNYAAKNNIKTGNTLSREKGIKDLLTKVFEKAGMAGSGILKNVGSIVKKVLLRAPLIGTAIDIFLNKASGQGTSEAIIRGLSSGISGMIGLKAGAAVGAGLGTVVIPGIGTAVGGLIGGIIGSIMAGTTGDFLAKSSLEAAGVKTTSNEKMAKTLTPKIDNIFNRVTGNDAVSKKAINSPASLINPTTPSTPAGMQLPENANTTNNFTVQSLPATMENMSREKKEVLGQQNPPSIRTSDPQTDFYRALASKNYQLNLQGAF